MLNITNKTYYLRKRDSIKYKTCRLDTVNITLKFTYIHANENVITYTTQEWTNYCRL